MRRAALLIASVSVAVIPCTRHTLAEEIQLEGRRPVIIIKADDMSTAGATQGKPISPRWQAFLDVVERKKIKATAGVQGWSLEQDNPAYFDCLKELHRKGIELWNHGYYHRTKQKEPSEFAGAPVEQQKAALEKTQRLAREKLGIELAAFGPHWCGTDEGTEKALEYFPEIKLWFGGPKNPSVSTKFIFHRTVDLEYPTFNPDLEKFKARLTQFEQRGNLEDYITLQGHPNAWDDRRLGEFVKIVDYLQERGFSFMTASEYFAARQKK